MKTQISYKQITTMLLLFFCGCSYAQNVDVIPRPQIMIMEEGNFPLLSSSLWYTNADSEDARYLADALPFPMKRTGKRQKAALQLLLIGKQENDSIIEGYKLSITQKGIVIEASHSAGLFYGLQSLRQLENNTLYPFIQVVDYPRFNYRGLMLDVSRHFYDKEFVLKQLDAMSHYKLNRLHLHLTDAAGWRLQIKGYPALTRIGAWRSSENWKKWWFEDGRKYAVEGEPGAFGGYYTQEDIRDIVAYAKARYITIIPEVELPAHSEEVLVAYPHLSCAGVPYANADFCAGNDSVFLFWTDVLKEVADLFPSQYIHIGGDEAGKAAWRNCPKCLARMEKEGLKDVDELQSYFIHRIERIVGDMGRSIIGWDEIMEGGLAPQATVMAWRNAEKAWEATKQGNKAILAPGQYCYLDAYQDNPFTQPEAIGGYLPLEKIYRYNPVPDSIPAAQAKLIEGVQANLWTEYVGNEAHCESMIYPRILALAETGWSEDSLKSWSDFHRRALLAVNSLQAAGYSPFDLANEYGNRPESTTPLNTISVGKKVIYNLPYHAAYPAQGDNSLTDGLRGGWTYGDGRWQGFIGRGRFDVTLDLGSIYTLNRIYADFLQSPGAEVYLPNTISISVSTDGEEFTQICDNEFDVDTQGGFCFRQDGWEGETTGRYVRFKANCSSSGGWIFTDEVIVEGH